VDDAGESGCLLAAGATLVSVISLILWRRGRLGRIETALYWLASVLTVPLPMAIIGMRQVGYSNREVVGMVFAVIFPGLAAIAFASALALVFQSRGAVSAIEGFIYWLGTAIVSSLATGTLFPMEDSSGSARDAAFTKGMVFGAILSLIAGAVLAVFIKQRRA
jgi:hypothetical protein